MYLHYSYISEIISDLPDLKLYTSAKGYHYHAFLYTLHSFSHNYVQIINSLLWSQKQTESLSFPENPNHAIAGVHRPLKIQGLLQLHLHFPDAPFKACIRLMPGPGSSVRVLPSHPPPECCNIRQIRENDQYGCSHTSSDTVRFSESTTHNRSGDDTPSGTTDCPITVRSQKMHPVGILPLPQDLTPHQIETAVVPPRHLRCPEPHKSECPR